MPKFGFKFSEESKRKMSLAKKGKKLSLKHRENMSKAHKGRIALSKNPMWKGGINHYSGYIYILKPEHPFSEKGGYIAKHRLVMEEYLGRYLTPKEIVHHKGIKYPIGSIENKQDNRIKNLQLFPSIGYHTNFHRRLNKM